MKRKGVVTSVTRRYIQICDEHLKEVKGKGAARDLEVCVGDSVEWVPPPVEATSKRGETNWEASIESISPRKNCLIRSFGRKSKQLAANIDLVVITSAPYPLFNSVVADRILVAASQQNIPCSLLINKIDQSEALSKTMPIIDVYQSIGVPTMRLSAKTGEGMEQLYSLLNRPEMKVIVFTGVSGVGKSTILNSLLPGIAAKTQDVSLRTGQGKQTTSQPRAYLFKKQDNSPVFIVDLPGIQNFGICHLKEEEIRKAFSEFEALAPACRFNNCRHLEEPDCRVQEALAEQKISQSRFKSYREMLEEVRAMREYSRRD